MRGENEPDDEPSETPLPVTNGAWRPAWICRVDPPLGPFCFTPEKILAALDRNTDRESPEVDGP
jgi:hypothetical protein